MKISGIQFINYNKLQFLNNYETLKQDNLPAENKTTTMGLWNTENKVKYSYVSAFGKKENRNDITSDHEESYNFKVRSIDNLICPSCGRPMLSSERYEKLKQQINKASEKEYVSILSKYIPYMREVEANVMEEIKDLNGNHPNLTLQELVTKLKLDKLPELESLQLEKLNKMEIYSNDLPDNEKPYLKKAISTAKTKIGLREIQHPFRKKTFIENINALPLENDNDKQNLIKIAESLPSSNESECAWIVKYSGKKKDGEQRNSKDIADRFLMSISTNTDHMLAQDREIGGQDRISNYILMHSGCNTEKANKTFMEWFDEAPDERGFYLQLYFEGVEKAISKGKIDDPRYINYVKRATNMITRLSGGELVFDFKKVKSHEGYSHAGYNY